MAQRPDNESPSPTNLLEAVKLMINDLMLMPQMGYELRKEQGVLNIRSSKDINLFANYHREDTAEDITPFTENKNALIDELVEAIGDKNILVGDPLSESLVTSKFVEFKKKLGNNFIKVFFKNQIYFYPNLLKAKASVARISINFKPTQKGDFAKFFMILYSVCSKHSIAPTFKIPYFETDRYFEKRDNFICYLTALDMKSTTKLVTELTEELQKQKLNLRTGAPIWFSKQLAKGIYYSEGKQSKISLSDLASLALIDAINKVPLVSRKRDISEIARYMELFFNTFGVTATNGYFQLKDTKSKTITESSKTITKPPNTSESKENENDDDTTFID